MTQEIDIIIPSIYIWENWSLRNLSKILTVVQLANQLAKEKLGSKSVHCQGVAFSYFFNLFIISAIDWMLVFPQNSCVK